MNLEKILKKHELWLNGEEGGERANLINADLRGADLRGADLWNADLRCADLSNANLSGADLEGADLRYANLWNANLSDAYLTDADLWNADLSDADLRYANLRGANLRCTNLCDANLRYADLINTDLINANLIGADLRDTDLRYANLWNIKTNMCTVGYNLVCPEKGSFIGYKKASGCIVELLILEDSKRISTTTMICRCNKAKVLDIENIETGKKVKEVSSDYDTDFIYKVGEIVTVDNFDDNRWNEYGIGIYFFINKENAINY